MARGLCQKEYLKIIALKNVSIEQEYPKLLTQGTIRKPFDINNFIFSNDNNNLYPIGEHIEMR